MQSSTVFLDEIAELSSGAQVALLRVLETGRLIRVGGSREIKVDVRIVAATHRDLETMTSDGGFRQDLLYRLNTMVFYLPPLRERLEEIAPLAEHFLLQAGQTNQRKVTSIEDAALEVLMRHRWPGNVRELRNVIERAVVITRGDKVTLEDLPEPIRAHKTERSFASNASAAMTRGANATIESELDFKTRVQRFEAELIEQMLHETNYNQSEASRRLKIPLRTLINKIHQYNISKKNAP